jgi:hypothetical protein
VLGGKGGGVCRIVSLATSRGAAVCTCPCSMNPFTCTTTSGMFGGWSSETEGADVA